VGVVEDWLNAYNARDFAAVAACLSKDDFERVGPYMDVIADSAEYVAFLARVVPTLGDEYRLVPEKVVYAPEDQMAFAQVVEHYRHEGEVRDTPEIIVFGLGQDGLVHRMRLYLQRPGGQAPVGGRSAMGATQS
jgi:Domain of unknown function (DUF4440)